MRTTVLVPVQLLHVLPAPRSPETKLYPLFGEIVYLIFIGLEQVYPVVAVPWKLVPPVPVLVIVTLLFTHKVVGFTVKPESGRLFNVIAGELAQDCSHAFSATTNA